MHRRSCIGLIAAAFLAGTAWTAAAATAELVCSFVWADPAPKFGGISGFDLARDGLTFRAVEDTGMTFAGKLARDADGCATAVRRGRIVPLRWQDGGPLPEDQSDAEGLALEPGAGFVVSFEGATRADRYARPDATAERLIWDFDTRDYNINEGFEALARSDNGWLYLVPELPPRGQHRFPLFRLRGYVMDLVTHIRQDGYWRPTGADFGPDGKLYLLERDYWGFVGFMSRVRRFTLDEDDQILREEILFETRAGTHDNLESIAVWRDDAGAIRLTLVSDDNFMPFQRTEIVDYRVKE